MKSIIQYINESSKNLSAICSDHFADWYEANVRVKEYFPKCKEEKNPKFLGVCVPEEFDNCKWLDKLGYEVKFTKTDFVGDDGETYEKTDVVYVYSK